MKQGVERDYQSVTPFGDSPGIVANNTTDTSKRAGASPIKRGSQRRDAFLFFAQHPGSCISDLEHAGIMPPNSVHGRVNELLGKNGKFNERHEGMVPLLKYGAATKVTRYGKEAHVIELTALGARALAAIKGGS